MDRKSGSAREKSYGRPENADAERRTENKTPRKIARKSRIVIAHVTIGGESLLAARVHRELAGIRADRMSWRVHKRTSTKGEKQADGERKSERLTRETTEEGDKRGESAETGWHGNPVAGGFVKCSPNESVGRSGV